MELYKLYMSDKYSPKHGNLQDNPLEIIYGHYGHSGMVGWWLYLGYDSFVPSMLPGLEKARQAELVEFLVFLVFSRKGGNKLIDINTKRTKITDFKKQVQDIWRFPCDLADFSVRFFLPVVRPGKETAVCHHMVFQQAILKQLMSEVLWSSHVIPLVLDLREPRCFCLNRLNLLGSVPSGKLSQQLQGCQNSKLGLILHH